MYTLGELFNLSLSFMICKKDVNTICLTVKYEDENNIFKAYALPGKY